MIVRGTALVIAKVLLHRKEQLSLDPHGGIEASKSLR